MMACVQVQQCLRDPRDPQAGQNPEQFRKLMAVGPPSHFVEQMAQASSLDFVARIRGHLTTLAQGSRQPRVASSPDVLGALASASSSSTAAAAAGGSALAGSGREGITNSSSNPSSSSSSSSISSNSSPAAVPLRLMCSRLKSISQFLGMFFEGIRTLLYSGAHGSQECTRPLLQLVSSPDIITTLICLTLSPELRATAADEQHALSKLAAECFPELQKMLGCFRRAMHTGFRKRGDSEHTIWIQLHHKMGAILTSPQNAPYLETLLFSTPGGGAHPVLGPRTCRVPAKVRPAPTELLGHSGVLPGICTHIAAELALPWFASCFGILATTLLSLDQCDAAT
jgi:hypothetical protein